MIGKVRLRRLERRVCALDSDVHSIKRALFLKRVEKRSVAASAKKAMARKRSGATRKTISRGAAVKKRRR